MKKGDDFMYELIQSIVGELPTEFTFIYSILTLVLSTLIICFLFQLFYIPINMLRK